MITGLVGKKLFSAGMILHMCNVGSLIPQTNIISLACKGDNYTIKDDRRALTASTYEIIINAL